MPYVVIEAATADIPFIIFDAGGVTELIEPKDYNNVRQLSLLYSFLVPSYLGLLSQ